MRMSQDTNLAKPSGTTKLASPLGRYFSGRGGLLVLGGIVVTLGVGLNWSWLAAAGITPILVGLLPCAAMCAIGLCLPRLMRANAAEQTTPRDLSSGAPSSSGTRPSPIPATAHADCRAPVAAPPAKDAE